MKIKWFISTLLVGLFLSLSFVNSQQSHPAREITPGTFYGGDDYIFPDYVGIGDFSTLVSNWLEVREVGRIQLTHPTVTTRWVALRNEGGSGTGLDLSYQGAPLWISAYDNQDIILNPGTGNVGIGADNPQEKLHVAGDIRLNAGGDIAFADDNTRIYESSDDLHITADDDIFLRPDDDIYIQADAGSDWVRFDTGNQRVGIGTTSPSEKLDVSGAIRMGTTTANNLGTIRWTSTDFEGYTASGWVSLTAGGAGADADWAAVGGGDPTLAGEIYHTGNVGIGINNPANRLHVVGSAANVVMIDSTSNNDLLGFYRDGVRKAVIGAQNTAGGDGFFIYHDSSTSFPFFVNEDGEVGIRTMDPDDTLDVNGVLQIDGNTAPGSGIQSNLRLGETSSYKWIQSYDSQPLVLNPIGNNVGIGTTNSNEKLTIEGALSLDEISAPSATSGYGKLYVKTDNKIYFKDDGGTEYDLTAGGADNDWAAVGGGDPTLAGDIYHTGDVGIGTNNPGAQLSLKYSTGTDQGQIYMDSGDDFHIRNNQQNNEIIVYDGTGGLGFWYNGVERMEIDSTGGVEVKGNLDVSGDIKAGDGALIRSTDWDGSNPWDAGIYSNSNGQWMRFVTNNADFAWFSDGGTGTNPIMELSSGGDLDVSGNIIGFNRREIFNKQSISMSLGANSWDCDWYGVLPQDSADENKLYMVTYAVWLDGGDDFQDTTVFFYVNDEENNGAMPISPLYSQSTETIREWPSAFAVYQTLYGAVSHWGLTVGICIDNHDVAAQNYEYTLYVSVIE